MSYMIIRWNIIGLLGLLLGLISCGEQDSPAGPPAAMVDYQHPIPFAPEKYVCYQTMTPLAIDGKQQETAWEKAPWTQSFVDIEGDLKPKPALETRAKMLWDKDYFYFYAQMEEPHIWAKLVQRDAVIYYDDDFEIFIDPDGDGHNYYEFEVNAFNTLWELLLLRPYRVDEEPKVLFNWNIPNIKTAVHIEGTLNDPSDEDQYWSVEMAIPWTALKELAPKERGPKAGEQWRVNFSRVDWTMEIKEGEYVKVKDAATGNSLPENNWVWSPTGQINMHMPEQWGYVQFSALEAGAGEEAFVDQPEEAIKWSLWQLYFQQLAYFEKNQRYSDDLKDFNLPTIDNADCSLEPVFYTSPQWFEIIAPSCDRQTRWRMRADGKLDQLSPITAKSE
ncbi:MAG: carbohydrate-binding family 9-like protein [Bacteroidota bacterium]